MTRSAQAPMGAIVAIAALAGLAASASAYVPTVTSVAQTGTSGALGPGWGGASFDPTYSAGFIFGTPSINAQGDVIFTGNTDLANPSYSAATQPHGVYVHHAGGANTNVALAGFFQPAPIYGVGTPNARFFSPGNPIFGTPDGYSSNIFSAPILNNSGQYMFQGGSSNSNIVSRGVAFGQNRDGYNGNTQSPAPQGAAYADFAPGTSINGTDLKFANVSSNSKKLFNNAGNWAFHAQLNANPAGASLPVYINTTTNAAPTSDINSGGFYVNTGGVSQLALRSSDRLLDLDATGNTKLGNNGTQAPQDSAFNANNQWVTSWNATQGNNVYSTSGQKVNGSSETVATNPNYNPANVQVNTNNAVIVSNRTGTYSRTVDGTTGYASITGLDVIARGGQVMPDGTGAAAASGFRYRQFSGTVGFNNNAKVAFAASINAANGGGTTTANIVAYNTQVSGAALFSDIGTGVVHNIANTISGGAIPTVYDATGTTATGMYAGSTWGTGTSATPVSTFILDGGDHVTFSNSSAIAGGTGITSIETGSPARTTALFQVGPDAKLRMMAQTGQVAPGATSATGANANHIYLSGGVTSNFCVNSLGQVAFVATLSAPAAFSTTVIASGAGINNKAVYATDVDGTLTKVVQLGDAWVDGMGVTRYPIGFGGFNPTGGQDGKTIQFNDNGDLTFTLYYTNTLGGTTIDGTAVVVAHIPTPGTLALLGLGGLIAGRRRR